MEANWNTITPPVQEGRITRLLVTARAGNGKLFTDTAFYANQHWLEWDDDYEGQDIDHNGGKKWTGWMKDTEDSCGDLKCGNYEYEVVAWAYLPTPYQP